ncbi:hypothetical protein DRQ53_11065 [bacterium]|nr:MAG: hypothetical protein DRQ53_11065 [bacterium]
MVHFHIEEAGRVRTVDLGDGRHMVGRAHGADIHLDSGTVSREHVMLEVRKDQVWVEDLGSLCGTYLGTRRLVHGDRKPFRSGELLRVAQVQMWAHAAPHPQPPHPRGTEFEITGSYGQFLARETSKRGTLPMLRHLFQLFSTGEDGDAIEHEACLFVKNWVQADRVCLFVAEHPGVAPTIRSWWSNSPLDPQKLPISNRLVRGVLDTGQFIAWSRDQGPVDLDDSRSRFDIHAAVAVPILAPPAIRGVLYADRHSGNDGYGEQDIEILTATATAVAMRRSVSQSRIETAEAAKIQRNMLPRSLPTLNGYELEAGLHMCHGVGGDLYDFICRPDEHCLLSVGDVSGKGLPAALLMGAASFLIRALAELELSPLEIYSRVHSNLLPKYRMRQYVALFLADLDCKTGQMRCVVAGVPRPLVIRADGSVEELEVTAFPAALTDFDDPPPTELSVQLAPGDLLAVYTDGYPEATPDGDRFLEAEVTDQLVRDYLLPLEKIRERLDRTVDDFVGLAGPSDDRTLLLLRRE